MRAATKVTSEISLSAEWQRIELLGHCLSQGRQGQQPGPEVLERLPLLQQQVRVLRAKGGVWQSAQIDGLSPLEYDILACAVATEAEPRLGWMFQHLQAGSPQPYPTRALLQDLLALDGTEAAALLAALDASAPLRNGALVEMEEEDPYQPIRPGAGVTARLLGRPGAEHAPPSATRVRQQAKWKDLVLSPDRITMLREFLLWIRHRETVVDKWGGSFTGGPVALFSGPSGTGKTYAAVVVACDLGWPLYRVDLGSLVSKYIGDTEKNINRMFDAAHGRSMILQFDEADSLFSKRGDVKEARDRYANMEVSHLLARIENHDGPCILTTNLRDNLDQAFARRFQMVVDFVRPDAAERARLWASLLPRRAPRDAEVDLEFLGAAVNLTGGGIHNSALHAAYLAAGANKPIGLGHVATAVWRELAKDGHEVARSDLGPLAEHLPKGI